MAPPNRPGRVPLGTWPTPVEPAPRLAERIGMSPDRLWIKRDDLTGLGAGGNKVRKLEYLCALALEHGATTLVTSGRAQSNHACLTASAARRLGLGCQLVLAGDAPDVSTGNLALEILLGAPVRWVGEVDDDGLDRAAADVVAELTERGERVELVPLGGSNSIGARGYVDCGSELEAQVPGFRHAVVAVGTGGTMAGLVAALGPERVLGVAVGATADVPKRIDKMVGQLKDEGVDGRGFSGGPLRIRDDQVGPGYGQLTEGARRALVNAAQCEGIILDPVYTAKALSGLEAEVRDGGIRYDESVVFVHTGGLPGLFGHEFIRDPMGPLGRGESPAAQ
ncbi:MAG: D-cysteine desulfhydrase family protein, partial [Acidimicrobiales bacterium]